MGTKYLDQNDTPKWGQSIFSLKLSGTSVAKMAIRIDTWNVQIL